MVKSIYHKYQKIASYIIAHKAVNEKNSLERTTAIDEHGKTCKKKNRHHYWETEIWFNEMNVKHLSVLNKQEEKIPRTISEI